MIFLLWMERSSFVVEGIGMNTMIFSIPEEFVDSTGGEHEQPGATLIRFLPTTFTM